MIITKALRVRTSSPADYAWSGLRRFQNVDHVTKTLIDLHKAPEKYHGDVKKQAVQLRQCLVQAREYFTAAKAVSLATKPNLLYYGAMSLALAEILFKHTGTSSLDKAREQHKHHGLIMTLGGTPRNAELSVAAQNLRASPMQVSGVRRGTFELWHQSSREPPLAGWETRNLADGGATKHFITLFTPIDSELPELPAAGVTLTNCLQALPLMGEQSAALGLQNLFIRGIAERNVWYGDQWRTQTDISFHPSANAEAVWECCKFAPEVVNLCDIIEAGSGLVLRLRQNWISGHTNLSLPPAHCVNMDEWRMFPGLGPLNEFGAFYVALFLAGNYARYYPDYWLSDVERSLPLALAIEELCTTAEWRVPWLTLSELSQTLLVNEA